MSLTLTADLAPSGTAKSMTVTGDVPDEIAPGFEFALDDEILVLEQFATSNPYAFPVVDDRNSWRVARRARGTLLGLHVAGTELRAVAPEFVKAADLVPPSPFEEGGQGTTAAPFALSRRVLTADAVIPADMSAVVVGPLDLAGFDIEFGANSALAILPDTP